MSSTWLDSPAPLELDTRFRRRIGFGSSPLNRKTLDDFLVAVGRSIPFENLALTDPDYPRVDPDSLTAKIVDRWEGGLCYETNPMLALALRANHLDVRVIRATIVDAKTEDWFVLPRTHVSTIVMLDGKEYVADVGFGLKQPLGLVPLDGSTVSTPHGSYRVAREVMGSEYMLQLRTPGEEWKNGYGFATDDVVSDPAQLDEVREAIANRPESTFNRGLLVALPTPTGHQVLSGSSLTEVRNGRKSSHPLTPDEVQTVAKLFFRSFE
ncbi:arylamine N-acetyltransferase [Lysinibacter sp. HNR]|uniref:arylamine N-acetyltransferase family protein n=1 Tax=Lysinibacter sp. HNR TaxID=3031408 RepID=UPI002434EC3A|nr:arylamine N-acetyltransferase [Lysinibacter sp. HNR]WGD37161.1 arylamine N-acetyltransferase [Lysinibacter sp. HNR]